MGTPLKKVKQKRGPKPGTGGRPRLPGAVLRVRLPEEAEEPLARGLALHGSYDAAVSVAVMTTYGEGAV